MTTFLPNSITVSYNGNFDGQLTIPAGATVSVSQGPNNGTFTLNTDGTYSYVPNKEYAGIDAVTIQQDFGGFTADKVIELNVLPNPINFDSLTPGTEDVISGSVTDLTISPVVAALSTGGYVSVYNGDDTVDASKESLYFNIYDADGTEIVAAEQANSTSVIHMRNSSVIGLHDGGFIVSWHDRDGGNSFWRRFDENGNAVTNEIDVSLGVFGENAAEGSALQVMQLDDGNLVVAWIATNDEIYLTRFDLLGNVLVTPGKVDIGAFDINGVNADLSAELLADESVALSWTYNASDEFATSDSDVATAIVGLDTQIVSPIQDVFTDDRGSVRFGPAQYDSQTIALAGGGYVIAFLSNHIDDQSTGPSNIYFRQYDASGNEVTTSLQAVTASSTTDSIALTDAIALADGGFMFVWHVITSNGSESDVNIFARRYDVNAMPVGDSFQLNSPNIAGQGQAYPQITQLTDGDIVVNWLSGILGTNTIVQERLTATGGTASYTFMGDDANDLLAGTSGNDIMYGMGNADFLAGWEGDDEMYGGDANDTLHGYSGDDYLQGDAGADILDGGEGDDELIGGIGEDTIYGWLGNDILDGGDNIDGLFGQGGADTLYGGAGEDLLSGGDGDDELNGGDDNDVLYGDAGNDIVNGDAGVDEIYGNDGNDTLSGGDNRDVVSGGLGNDIVNGDSGSDFLYGDAGNDTINGGDGVDRLEGWIGMDILNGGDGEDTLLGGDDDDQLNGGAQDDFLDAGTGSDVLNGDAGDDELHGWLGNDTLSGGTGNDLMYGHDGDDTYIFGAGDGQDMIRNFDLVGHDVVDFSAGVETFNLWLSKDGHDLVAEILGTTDTLTFDSWYLDDGQQVDELTLDGGETLALADIEGLVTAMAAFDPATLGPVNSLTDLPQAVQDAIAASWA